MSVIQSQPRPKNYYQFRKTPEWSDWLTKIKVFTRSSDKPQNINIILGSSNDMRPIVQIQLGHLELPALVDTGATRSIIGASAWNQLAHIFSPYLRFSSLAVSTADGNNQLILGEISMPFSGFKKSGLHDFVVVPSITTPVILGVDFCRSYGLKFDFSTAATDIVKIDIASLATNVLTEDQVPLIFG